MLQTQFNGLDYEIKIWHGEKLGNSIAADTETTFRPFTETPDLVTFQAFDGLCVYYIDVNDTDLFFRTNQRSVFIFANASFDIDVLCKKLKNKDYFHPFIEADQIRDIILLFKLYHLATVGHVPFKYSLAYITQRLLNVELDKNEDVRDTFEQYLGKSIHDISSDHLAYGARDVIATLFCYNRLINLITSTGSTTLLSHQIQLVGSIALNRIYKNGIAFDVDRGKIKLGELDKQLDYHQAQLSNYGWVRGQKGINQRYEDIVNYYGLELPKTESGSISSASEDLQKYKDNPFIYHYLKFNEIEKLSSFIRDLVE